eukprot:SAG11_NODE_14854_length_597_cov_1.453815_1_plen_102_part_00
MARPALTGCSTRYRPVIGAAARPPGAAAAYAYDNAGYGDAGLTGLTGDNFAYDYEGCAAGLGPQALGGAPYGVPHAVGARPRKLRVVPFPTQPKRWRRARV